MTNFEKLAGVISEYTELDVSEINEETNLRSDLGIDSYELINLVCEIEKEFGIKVADRDIANIATVKDVLDYVASQQ